MSVPNSGPLHLVQVAESVVVISYPGQVLDSGLGGQVLDSGLRARLCMVAAVVWLPTVLPLDALSSCTPPLVEKGPGRRDVGSVQSLVVEK